MWSWRRPGGGVCCVMHPRADLATRATAPAATHVGRWDDLTQWHAGAFHPQ